MLRTVTRNNTQPLEDLATTESSRAGSFKKEQHVDLDHVQFVINAHTNHARKPSKAVRKWDARTPYWVHPIWCATTLAAETALPETLRHEGFLTLLYHDVLEDTTCELPAELPETVVAYVRDMTYKGGFAEEVERVWEARPEVRLFKLFDKVHNLLDGAWMSPEKREKYAAFTLRLAADAERNFDTLAIARMARAIAGR